MKRIRLLGVMLLAVFALSAVGATAAQATEAPFWSIEGTRLGEGKTRNITVKTANETTAPWKLSGGGVTVTCKKTEAKPAVLLGSAPTEPGTDNETVKFSGCTVSGNGEKCTEVVEPIETKPLKSESVLDSTKTKVLTLFTPVSGSEFAKLTFKGSGCTFATTAVESSAGVAGEDLEEKEKPVEESNHPQGVKGFVNFPATTIKTVVLITSKGEKTIEKVGLKAFGLAATLIGRAAVEVEGGLKWSALP